MRPLVLAGAVALAACGGASSGPSVAPVGSSGQAVRGFMQAAADSNLAMMAQLWGTPDGPAATTGKPPGWEKRLIVIQVYLRGDSTRIVSDVPVTGKDNQRQVTMALYRSGCVRQIPAIVTRTRAGGWLVQEVDIGAAGNPARPCEPGPGDSDHFTR